MTGIKRFGSVEVRFGREEIARKKSTQIVKAND